MLRVKKLKFFALILYTFIELFGSAFGNEQKKLYAHFSLTQIDCVTTKIFSVPFDVVLCSEVNF